MRTGLYGLRKFAAENINGVITTGVKGANDKKEHVNENILGYFH